MTPTQLLFAQHGWADTPAKLAQLAHTLADQHTLVVAPDLGYLRTWLRIAPLIDQVEQLAAEQLARFPDLPLKIIGHSMGGLIWTEVLHRNPQWHARVAWFALLASPIGGAHMGRVVDPLNLGLGIAADLGRSRRPSAAALAKQLPMLVLAGATDVQSDGVVMVAATRIPGAPQVVLPGMSHTDMRYHAWLVELLQHYDATGSPCHPPDPDLDEAIMEVLYTVRGMTDAHRPPVRLLPVLRFNTGTTVSVGRNLAGLEHVYMSASDGTLLYGGYVGWTHESHLYTALNDLKQDFAERLWRVDQTQEAVPWRGF